MKINKAMRLCVERRVASRHSAPTSRCSGEIPEPECMDGILLSLRLLNFSLQVNMLRFTRQPQPQRQQSVVLSQLRIESC